MTLTEQQIELAVRWGRMEALSKLEQHLRSEQPYFAESVTDEERAAHMAARELFRMMCRVGYDAECKTFPVDILFEAEDIPSLTKAIIAYREVQP